MTECNRREFFTLLGLGLAFPHSLLANSSQLQMKKIPSTGQMIPIIGMGTSRTFNVGKSARLRQSRLEVLKTFLAMGGQVIDSSPMYGSAEEVTGDLLKQLQADTFISATKVWTEDTQEGKEQFQNALKLWHQPKIDIYQIHNLLNWKEHLKVLRKYKEEGKIKYIGITTSHGRRTEDFQEIMKSEKLDFAQITYNLNERWHEEKTFKMAQDRGIATIINRPFQRGDLFDSVKGKKLPDFAKSIGCDNWAQFFLKWVVSHPGVTCAIPATTQVAHMNENMGALRGPLPDVKMRAEMLKYFQSL